MLASVSIAWHSDRKTVRQPVLVSIPWAYQLPRTQWDLSHLAAVKTYVFRRDNSIKTDFTPFKNKRSFFFFFFFFFFFAFPFSEWFALPFLEGVGGNEKELEWRNGNRKTQKLSLLSKMMESFFPVFLTVSNSVFSQIITYHFLSALSGNKSHLILRFGICLLLVRAKIDVVTWQGKKRFYERRTYVIGEKRWPKLSCVSARYHLWLSWDNVSLLYQGPVVQS